VLVIQRTNIVLTHFMNTLYTSLHTHTQGFLHPTRALRNLVTNAELQTYKQRAMRGEFDRFFEFGHGAAGDPRWTINGLHVCT
jgi:hypothetical protein